MRQGYVVVIEKQDGKLITDNFEGDATEARTNARDFALDGSYKAAYLCELKPIAKFERTCSITETPCAELPEVE